MNDLNANDVLELIGKRAQWCRENGESDMRNILNTVRGIERRIKEGESREEILAYFADDEEES